jgi:hypothetical protein
MKLRVTNDNDSIYFVSLFSFWCTDQDNPDLHIFNDHGVSLIIFHVVDISKLKYLNGG